MSDLREDEHVKLQGVYYYHFLTSTKLRFCKQLGCLAGSYLPYKDDGGT